MKFKMPELENRVFSSNESVAPAEAILVIDGIVIIVVAL